MPEGGVCFAGKILAPGDGKIMFALPCLDQTPLEDMCICGNTFLMQKRKYCLTKQGDTLFAISARVNC